MDYFEILIILKIKLIIPYNFRDKYGHSFMEKIKETYKMDNKTRQHLEVQVLLVFCCSIEVKVLLHSQKKTLTKTKEVQAFFWSHIEVQVFLVNEVKKKLMKFLLERDPFGFASAARPIDCGSGLKNENG